MKKKKIKSFSFILILVYIAMVLLALKWNIKPGQPLDIYNIGITITIFVIVGITIGYAVFKYFNQIEKITEELCIVAKRIEKDSKKDYADLWNIYRFEEDFFSDRILSKVFDEYKTECQRMERFSSNGYRCDIEDYINEELIDDTIHKGLLSIVPGFMTGLGILGTFIGLSIGLQHFSTEEITNSIAPLMEGIKVAFHTSIYGMFFSLTFNWVYKAELEAAYRSVDTFLSVFHRHVCPSAENDSINRILSYQSDQSSAASSLSRNISVTLVRSLKDILVPQFERLNETTECMMNYTRSLDEAVARTVSAMLADELKKMNIAVNDFTSMATRTQTEGMQKMVEYFMKELDRRMGDSFRTYQENIKETCELQEKQNTYMNEVLENLELISKSIKDNVKSSKQVSKTFASILESFEKQQTSLSENIENMNRQSVENEKLLYMQEECLKSFESYNRILVEEAEKRSIVFSQQIDFMKKAQMDLEDNTEKNISKISDSIGESVDKISASVNEWIKMCDSVQTGIQKNSELYMNYMQQHMDNMIFIERKNSDEKQQELEKMHKMMINYAEELRKDSLEHKNFLREKEKEYIQFLEKKQQAYETELREKERECEEYIKDLPYKPSVFTSIFGKKKK